jgi:CheY-like chemotaxis protein
MSDVPVDGPARDAVAGSDQTEITVLHVDDEQGVVETAGLWLERVSDRLTVVTETAVVDALDRIETTDDEA